MPPLHHRQCGVILLLMCLAVHILNQDLGYFIRQYAIEISNNSTTQKQHNNLKHNHNQNNANVTLTFKSPRNDRMGSRTQLPYGAWLIARYHGWNFCSPDDPMARILSFPICSDSSNKWMLEGLPEFPYGDDNITKPGAYYISKVSNTNTLWATISQREREGNLTSSMFTDESLKEWRDMILGAKLRPELNGELWLHGNSARIAVHVRRGDILPGVRNDIWIGDDQTITLIEMARYYLRKRRGPDVEIEVHLFSEDYGATNWTRFGDLVDEFHLAPRGSHDLELNVRDWKHFVTADVLITGGSFSFLPGLARPKPSSEDGLPITIYRSKMSMAPVRHLVRWVHKDGGTVISANFPDGTITANNIGGSLTSPAQQSSDTTADETHKEEVTVDMMMEGLCHECKTSSVPGAYKCGDRIQRYVPAGSAFSAFLEVQKKVSEKSWCAACNPESCRVRVPNHGPALPIESIVGTQYEQTCPLFSPSCLEEEYKYL